MQALAYLDFVRRLPVVSRHDLTGGNPFIVLSPHPDDETLGAGGLIASACEAGESVGVVLVSDGSGSHPGSIRYPRDRLIALRAKEIALALKRLGLPSGRLRSLGLPDRHVPLEGPSFGAAVERVVDVILTMEARSLFVTWHRDPHCDHEAAHRIALAARRAVPHLRLLAYPIWGWHLADTEIDDPPPQGGKLPIEPWLDMKSHALSAYASQMTGLIDDDPDGFCFPKDKLAPFVGPFEHFIEVA